MIRGIDHIAVAVANLDKAIEFFEKTLGLELTHRESMASHGVETATFNLGGAAIELVEGKGEESAVRKFVKTRGEGIHHIAFEVEDLEGTLEAFAAKGVRPVDESPRPGKENTRVSFLHPKSTWNILIELVESDRGNRPEK